MNLASVLSELSEQRSAGPVALGQHDTTWSEYDDAIGTGQDSVLCGSVPGHCKYSITAFRETLNTLNLHHAQYQFDTQIRQLVDDLINKPNLSPTDVSQQVLKLAEQADRIYKLDSNVSTTQLAQRFAATLDESLHSLARDAVARGDFTKLKRVAEPFMQDGALQDINSALLSAARHKPAMAVTPANLLNLDYTHGHVREPANPQQHAFSQRLLAKMQTIPAAVSARITVYDYYS